MNIKEIWRLTAHYRGQLDGNMIVKTVVAVWTIKTTIIALYNRVMVKPYTYYVKGE